MMGSSDTKAWPQWHDRKGEPLACVEKIRVLNENLAELETMAQDAFEDAMLMGADEQQVRTALCDLMDRLHNPYGR